MVGEAVASGRRRRTPAWRDVEGQEPSGRTWRRAAVRSSARTRARTERRRYALVHDIDGPRIRLGVLWFVVVLGALVAGGAGPVGTALVYAPAAGLAAAQAATAWRRVGGRPHVLTAGVGAGVLPLAAALTTGLLGLALLGVAAAAVLTAPLAAATGRRRDRVPHPPLAVAGLTVRCAAPVGMAAAALVCAMRFEPGAGVALVLVVSAFEVGDYIVGSGARNVLEGPIAGAAAILVVQFGMSALNVPPFELPSGLAFAAVAAVACPLGQVVASAVLPSNVARAPALRRLDSLMVLAPIWAVVVGAMAVTQ